MLVLALGVFDDVGGVGVGIGAVAVGHNQGGSLDHAAALGQFGIFFGIDDSVGDACLIQEVLCHLDIAGSSGAVIHAVENADFDEFRGF